MHPGYGFLAERADFAARSADAGLVFVGPRPEVLAIFGDRVGRGCWRRVSTCRCCRARAAPTSVEDARTFLAAEPAGGAVVLKAIAGGGGRGMRVVRDPTALAEACARCRSEAASAFGSGDLYVERYLPRARHVEVQIVGDGGGAVVGARRTRVLAATPPPELVEIAPSPSLGPALRARLIAAALRLAEEVRYGSLGTFEFLVDAAAGADDGAFYFLEANPRLQVEHTVTEAVTGVDLVATQLQLAGGAALATLGLGDRRGPAPRGHAIQLRVNMETMRADGDAKAGGGTLTVFEPPAGPGVRVDTFGVRRLHRRTRASTRSLAKIVVHAPVGGFASAVARARRALAECRIEGVPTNLGFLQALLRPSGRRRRERRRHGLRRAPCGRAGGDGEPAPATRSSTGGAATPALDRRAALAGARVDPDDPLAGAGARQERGRALVRGGRSARSGARAARSGERAARSGGVPLDRRAASMTAAMRAHAAGADAGHHRELDVAEGDVVHAGQTLLVMEAMKMEHVVPAERAGVVRRIAVGKGDTVFEGHVLVLLDAADVEERAATAADDVGLEDVRPDLAEVLARHTVGHDAARPEAVARRRATGQRTARENVDDLCDPGRFVEYGALVIAAQRQRRSVDDLIATHARRRARRRHRHA